LEIKDGATLLATYGSTVTIGEVGASKSNVYITSGTLQLRNNITPVITLGSDGSALFGQTGASQSNVYVASGAVHIRNNVTDVITLAADGSITMTGKMIGPENFVDYAVGDVVVAAAMTSTGYIAAGSYTKVKEISLSRGGSIRCKMKVSTSGGSSNAYGRVYRNGVAVGSQNRGGLGSTWNSYSEDISGWTAGDLCQVYMTKGSNTDVAVKDVQVCVSNPETTTVVIN
jgi:hypothetical protein